MNIVFFGTSECAVPILKALVKIPAFDIVCVVTEPAKPQGRAKVVTPSPVEQAAQAAKLEVYTPATLKDEAVRVAINDREADVYVVASYGKIIPQEIFDSPPLKTLNIHASLLPEYRGASPIQQTLLEGRERAGVTLIRIDEQVDHGPILSQDEIIVAPTDIYTSLEAKLAKLGAEMLVRDLPGYGSGILPLEEQDHDVATYTRKITKEDGRADWSRPAHELYNQWRAYERWPGLYTSTSPADGNLRLNLITVNMTEHSGPQIPGTFYAEDGKLYVHAARGSLKILAVQPEGRREMSAKDFINGYKQLIGTVLR